MMGGDHRAVSCFRAGLMAFLVLLAPGCGKKGMPVPPNRITPPAVTDFKGQLTEGQLELRWRLPEGAGEKSGPMRNVSPAEVMVYRSKLPLEAGGCKNCPLRFEPIASLAPPSGGKGAMRYGDKLERGFRYTYKIVLVGENSALSPDSDLLDITY
jgi:hypothetical protein